MCDDPIVAEVRAIRREIATECGQDLHEAFQRACEVQKRRATRQAKRDDVSPPAPTSGSKGNP
jgi:hypothetical protein